MKQKNYLREKQDGKRSSEVFRGFDCGRMAAGFAADGLGFNLHRAECNEAVYRRAGSGYHKRTRREVTIELG
jgi:hypothetical protein